MGDQWAPYLNYFSHHEQRPPQHRLLPTTIFLFKNRAISFPCLSTHSHVALSFCSPASPTSFPSQIPLQILTLYPSSTDAKFHTPIIPLPLLQIPLLMKISSSFYLPSNDAAADGCFSGILRRFLCVLLCMVLAGMMRNPSGALCLPLQWGARQESICRWCRAR